MTDQRSSYQLSSPLRTVLNSLEVNLEVELSRYRRKRASVSPPSSTPLAELEEAAFDLSTVDSTIDEISASVSPAAALVTPPPLPRNKKLFPDRPAAIAPSSSPPTNGYLASSEKLIESLSEAPPTPEPVTATPYHQRRTSLLAGAALGLLGLVAGLGASYLLSNPQVAQRLADGSSGDRATIAAADEETFTPTGPDLSAQEFINLELDNLSSLKMPQVPLDPQAQPATPALPPIANEASSPTQSETQSVAIPAGSNYYVTVPFATEQGLLDIRKSVDEAFVRQFAGGGTRIQLAAFNNVESAQKFIEELKGKGITAQVYGPTSE